MSRRRTERAKPAMRAKVGRAALHRLAAELRRCQLELAVDAGPRSVRLRGGKASPWLRIGVRELAEAAAIVATRRTRGRIFHRIFLEVDRKNNRRIVMARCREFSKLLQGRRGFSALRLYNDYYKARRTRGRKAVK